MSIDYYNKNAESFINNTNNVDMTLLYSMFEKYLTKGSSVLDLGCGSGRDSKYFSDRGFNVVSVDGSIEMIKFCSSYLDNTIVHSTFEDFISDDQFEGIWACASLLHIKRKELPKILTKYVEMLKSGGVFFMSFKNHDSDYEKDGRHFTCFSEAELVDFISQNSKLQVIEVLVTKDVRFNRSDERWVSLVGKK